MKRAAKELGGRGNRMQVSLNRMPKELKEMEMPQEIRDYISRLNKKISHLETNSKGGRGCMYAKLEKEFSDFKRNYCIFSELVVKKPDYFWSFSGHLVFNEWRRKKGLNLVDAELLIVLSYHKILIMADLDFWWIFERQQRIRAIDRLMKGGWIQKVPSPGAGNGRRNKHALILTPAGEELERDYERYYDKKMKQYETRDIREKNVWFYKKKKRIAKELSEYRNKHTERIRRQFPKVSDI